MPKRKVMFHALIEAPLQELFTLEPRIEDPVLKAYAQVLIGYLSAESERMEAGMGALKTLAPDSLPYWLAVLRSEIRKRSITEGTLATVRARLSSDSLWKGEAHFVLARASEILDRHEAALLDYEEARHAFLESGCRKKAVKCRQNAFAVQSRISPKRSFIDELSGIVGEARQVGEFGIAGVALMNISREHQAMGALSTALKNAHRALALMARDQGSIHYYLALIHRAHLQLEMGRDTEARLDFEAALLSPHAEIKAALRQLARRFDGGRFEKSAIDQLTWSWRGRVWTDAMGPSFGALEDQLIRELSNGPRKKSDLIQALWNGSDPEDFRFKRLLQRVRKKRPGLVRFRNGSYVLAQVSFIRLPSQQRKQRKKAG